MFFDVAKNKYFLEKFNLKHNELMAELAKKISQPLRESFAKFAKIKIEELKVVME